MAVMSHTKTGAKTGAKNRRDAQKECNSFENVRVALRARLRGGMFCQ